MRRAFAATVLGGLLVLWGASGASAAEGGAPAHLTMSSATTAVSGRPVQVHVALTDARGHGIGGALIRLETTTSFLGADRTEVLDEARTSSSGKALLTFSPVDTGSAVVRATFAGDDAYAGAQASLTFSVTRAVATYHPTPVGLQAPWARSYLILVPVLGIWITYGVVLTQVRQVRRAGLRTPGA
jgi:hypothetical protein